MPLALLLFPLNCARNYAMTKKNVLILARSAKNYATYFFFFFFLFFFNTNANTWHQSYNASTFLVIRNLIERQKNHIIFCQFSSKNVWMVGGNLNMTGSGLPAARPQVRLSNTWTHLDTQMPYFMLQSRPKQARKCSLCVQRFFFFSQRNDEICARNGKYATNCASTIFERPFRNGNAKTRKDTGEKTPLFFFSTLKQTPPNLMKCPKIYLATIWSDISWSKQFDVSMVIVF